MIAQRIQFLEKYAAMAEDILRENTDKYTPEDIEKLAEALIKMDIRRANDIDNVEDLVKQGQSQARGFAKEISELAGKDALLKLAKLGLLEKAKKTFTFTKTKETIDTGKKFIRTFPKEAAGLFAGGLGTGAIATGLMSD